MDQLARRIYDALCSFETIDPHTHIDPRAPAARTLADLLGYHYYTELAHSAGLPRAVIEEPGLEPKERVARLVESLHGLDNTVQCMWMLEILEIHFGIEVGPACRIGAAAPLTRDNWESIYDETERRMAAADWTEQVLQRSRLQRVFLTNEFDDPLEGFDTARYVPCLRTDDFVFKLADPTVRTRLAASTGIEPTDAGSLVRAIGATFERFRRRGARACAISLPPQFTPTAVDRSEVEGPLGRLLRGGSLPQPSPPAGGRGQGEGGPVLPAPSTGGTPAPLEEDAAVVAHFVFWTLADFCNQFRFPFDLMLGVNRRVYEGGVHQGQDLFDGRMSLIQYAPLFNAFPQVAFPVSVLASGTNQELVAYSWIFPNVLPFGHWWYSNVPAYIEPDLRARLQAVPRSKLLGYYSDAYKLEFVLPKFNMYRRALAGALASDFVRRRAWNEEQAIDLGRHVLCGNLERVFGL